MKQKIISDIKSLSNPETTLSDFCSDKDYTRSQLLYRFDTWTNAKAEAGLDVHSIECPKCGVSCKYISNHWSKCGEPELSKKQKSLITGMLLSDGTVNENSMFTAYSANREFLEWFSDELGFMSYPVTLNDTGEDRRRRNAKSGFDTRKDSSYKDVHRVAAPKHSFTEKLRDWYVDGKKTLLDRIDVDSTSMKLWYAGDGGLHLRPNDIAYAEIRPISFDKSHIIKHLDNFGVDYSIQTDNTVSFYANTDEFLEKIGPAPKGMEYKWETDKRERYERLKP